MKLKNLLLLILPAFMMAACGDDNTEAPLFKHVAVFNMDNILNVNTIVPSSTSHSGKNICHVDSGQGFGVCYMFQIPDSLIGKTIAVSVDAWIRNGKLDNHCDIICSVIQHDSILSWQGFGAENVIKTPNEWSNLKGTIVIPPNHTDKPNTSINIAVQNADAKSFFDVDDLLITYLEVDKP